jgi:hypothetical protein
MDGVKEKGEWNGYLNFLGPFFVFFLCVCFFSGTILYDAI